MVDGVDWLTRFGSSPVLLDAASDGTPTARCRSLALLLQVAAEGSGSGSSSSVLGLPWGGWAIPQSDVWTTGSGARAEGQGLERRSWCMSRACMWGRHSRTHGQSGVVLGEVVLQGG